MKVADLRNKTIVQGAGKVELNKQLKDQFKQKMQMATGQLSQTHLLKQVRRRCCAELKRC
jgi:large subunit ribosomal protein L29